jgi:DNA-binding response OmpR family regulator
MKALIVDDDRVLADVVAFTLRREGFEVSKAYDGQAALERWAAEQPDLIVLDINLPKLNGFDVCQQIRRHSDTPILLLTVRAEEDDIVRGLELGADDYITKPFSPRQLVARAQAIMRRVGKKTAPSIRQVGRFTLDPSRREIRLGEDGLTISLTPLVSQLLDYLMLNSGQVLTNESIIEQVWGAEGGDRDMLRQLIHRLRGKITQAAPHQEDLPKLPRIETIPGLGYGLSLDTEE